jgi:hypothetical protein
MEGSDSVKFELPSQNLSEVAEESLEKPLSG